MFSLDTTQCSKHMIIWWYLVMALCLCSPFFCPLHWSFFVHSYSVVLRHTTEEVLDACIEAIEPVRAALTSHLRSQVMESIMKGLKKHDWFRGFDISDELPKRYTLDQWIKQAKKVEATVFIAGSNILKKFIVTQFYVQFQFPSLTLVAAFFHSSWGCAGCIMGPEKEAMLDHQPITPITAVHPDVLQPAFSGMSSSPCSFQGSADCPFR